MHMYTYVYKYEIYTMKIRMIKRCRRALVTQSPFDLVTWPSCKSKRHYGTDTTTSLRYIYIYIHMYTYMYIARAPRPLPGPSGPGGGWERRWGEWLHVWDLNPTHKHRNPKTGRRPVVVEPCWVPGQARRGVGSELRGNSSSDKGPHGAGRII